MQQFKKMTPSSTNASKTILILGVVASFLATSANAFRSSVTTTPPISTSIDLPMKETSRFRRTKLSEETKSNADTFSIDKVTTLRRNFKYDLGLGKNKPVTNKRAGESSPVEKGLDPTRFLIEYESIQTYPSPLNSVSEGHSRNSDERKRKRKILPRVQHRRHSEDVLHIRDPDSIVHIDTNYQDDNFCHPIIVPINHFPSKNNVPGAKLDVNTVWVEMMLHNEQKQSLLCN